MIPQRFAVEYPQRCLELLEKFELIAHESQLTGTFSVMLAASILIVPWERTGRHPLIRQVESDLLDGLRRLKKQSWMQAEFWQSEEPGEWRYSRIMGDPNDVQEWHDDAGRRTFSSESNSIGRRKVDDVFRVLRNALAHGNILYLDEYGLETAGERVEHIAFLSRYEETEDQRKLAETYRLVTIREGQFLSFVRAWAIWVSAHGERQGDLRAA